MSSFGNWLWGTNQIDEAVDKATSELLPAGAEDIALNLEICDQIRSKTAPANTAMRALKRRLNHKNPNVQLLALGLTDICVKNGGDHFLTEVASREFMDNLVSILKIPVLNHDVKNNILRLIQNWSVAFEGKPSLGYVGQVYRTLSSEGFKFPPKDFTSANAAMVDTQTAPEWIDSDVCLRCRTPFTFTNRKHHCRNCGQVFDQACSSKSIPLPHFGITQEVRVCDSCYSKITKKGERADRSHRHSQSVHGTGSSRHRSARDLADAELQRAIQLSLEESSRASNGYRPGYVSSQPDPSRWQASEPPIVEHPSYPRRAKSLPPPDEEDEDLKAAIEASLREASAPRASAPEALPTPQSESLPRTQPQSSIKLLNYDLQPTESDVILRFSQQVEQAQASGRKDVLRYPDVSALYETASGLRSKLAMSLDDTGRKEQLLTEMHEKMSQIVKLYDGLLSEQLAHPRWRTQSMTTGPPPQQYQQANSVYSTGYNPVNGYTQWNQAPAPQASASPQQQTTWYTQQTQVAEPAQYQYAPPQQQPENAQPGPSHQQNPAYSQQQQQQAQSHYAPPAPPEAYQQPSIIPVPAVPASMPYQTSTLQPIPPQVSSIPAPVAYQPQPITQSTLPPVSVSQSPPITHYSPPPAVLTPPSLPQTSPTLSRQNTISTYLPQTQTQSSVSPSAPSSSPHLSRSNTIATSYLYHSQTAQPPQAVQQPNQPVQQPQQQLPTFPPVSALPVFPSAPTAAPQSMYPSPQQQPQSEREALLIEL